MRLPSLLQVWPQQQLKHRQRCLARIIIDAPSGERWTPEVDGNGQFSATTDGLIVLRVMFGMNVSAAINGAINAAGSRNSNVLLRDYLLTHCGINPVL